MSYEFYIDQFFLEHLLTDTILLALTAVLLRKRVRICRLLAGGVLGAAAMTLLVCAGQTGLWPLGLLAAGTACFLEKRRRGLPGCLLALLFVTVCFGGVLGAAQELLGLPVAAASAFSAMAFSGGAGVLGRRRAREQNSASVTIRWQEHTVRTRGLIDTGNRLYEPMTGKPVSVLDGKIAGELLPEGWENRRGFYLVPYHSVGCEQGWMRAVAVDEMTVDFGGRTVTLERPVLAVTEGRLSAHADFGILLHRAQVGDGTGAKKAAGQPGAEREPAGCAKEAVSDTDQKAAAMQKPTEEEKSRG